LPSIDSSVSFSRSAKHLFRHLHEEDALRNNHLVRRFFENRTVADLGSANVHNVLEQIHILVREAAEYCRDADRAAGREERGLRQHAIIQLQYFERRSIHNISSTLGISVAHCYRERANICQRIARYILKYDPKPALDYLRELDEFQVLMDRALNCSTFSDMKAAFAECDYLVSHAPSAIRRIEALGVSVSASLAFGKRERADAEYRSAEEMLSKSLRAGSLPDSDYARGCLDVMGSKLARFTGSGARALSVAQHAVSRLAKIRQDTRQIRKLYLESLYELGLALCNLGDLDNGYDYIASAEADIARNAIPPSRLCTAITVEAWRLRNHLLMSSKSWYPSSQRLRGLEAAFEQAYAPGWISEAIGALVGLVEYHAYVGQSADALRAARLAVLLAEQQPNKVRQARTRIAIAEPLMATSSWQYALSVFTDEATLEGCGALLQEALSYVAAARAFRLCRFNEAWRFLSGREGRRGGRLPAQTLSEQILAAATAHAIGRLSDATALIEATLPAAEELQSAPILKDACDVAATVTGDHRFRRRAAELGQLLVT